MDCNDLALREEKTRLATFYTVASFLLENIPQDPGELQALPGDVTSIFDK